MNTKTMIIATALATMISGAAFAQANPNAPQPSSDGLGVNIPGTTSTGVAVDRPDSNQPREDARMQRGILNQSPSDYGTTGMSNRGTYNGGMSR
jgi:hypothetical protein